MHRGPLNQVFARGHGPWSPGPLDFYREPNPGDHEIALNSIIGRSLFRHLYSPPWWQKQTEKKLGKCNSQSLCCIQPTFCDFLGVALRPIHSITMYTKVLYSFTLIYVIALYMSFYRLFPVFIYFSFYLSYSTGLIFSNHWSLFVCRNSITTMMIMIVVIF